MRVQWSRAEGIAWDPKAPAAVGLVVVALVIVYVVWGSTYLGIRVVVEEAPPFLGIDEGIFEKHGFHVER